MWNWKRFGDERPYPGEYVLVYRKETSPVAMDAIKKLAYRGTDNCWDASTWMKPLPALPDDLWCEIQWPDTTQTA